MDWTVTPLVGRETLVASVIARLTAGVRLLTLTGTGGVGKTRVALQVLEDAADHFPDGRWFVALAPIRDAALVPVTIAQAAAPPSTARGAVYGAGDRLDTAQLSSLFSGKQLLVLDNFEHLTPAALLIGELLAHCAGLTVLVTSRASLHLSGEHELPVPPLALPGVEERRDVRTLAQYPAVALFVQRAQAVNPQFSLREDNASAVVEICRRLDGLPLSLELAAARVKLLPPQAMLARMEYRLHLLTGGPRDAPSRQQSLRDTLDWSFALLDAGEQRLFRRLGVFAGGCTLEAIEAVTQESGEVFLPVLDRVSALLDKSLIFQEEQPGGTPRIAMLQTTREYASEQLRAADEEAMIRRRHAACYLVVAEQAGPHLSGAQQQHWLETLEREIHNLRAALDWVEHSTALAPDAPNAAPPKLAADEEAITIGLRMHAALWKFWAHRGHLHEGRQSLARLLARAARLPTAESEAYTAALTSAGLLAIRGSDFGGAAALLEQALARWEALGAAGRAGAAAALDGLGWAAAAFGDFTHARELYARSLDLLRQFGGASTPEAADVLAHLGMVEFMAGRPAQARPLLEESLAIKRAHEETWGAAFALYMLGAVAVQQQRHDDALHCLEEAYQLSAELGEQILRAFLLETMAWSLITQVRPAPRHAGAGGHDLPDQGVQVYSAATALRRKYGQPQPPQWARLLSAVVNGVRAEMGERRFQAAWAQGEHLSPGEAFSLYQSFAASSPVAYTAILLTPREREVLRLLARGDSDAQIAEQLVLSVRTVHAHLQSLYGKLGVHSRTAALRAAQDSGLLP